ncbi:MAG: hypothetical protein V1659_01395 [Candidatus Woesearchaeota archaeon]
MRRKKTEAGQKRTRIIIMGLFIVAVMVFSSFAVFMDNPASGLKYNGFSFKYDDTGQMFSVKINKEEFFFRNHPADLEYINVSKEAVELYKNADEVYITFEPKEDIYLGLFDSLRLDFSKNSGRNVLGATTESSTLYDLPVKTCQDANQTSAVIYLKVGDATSVSLDDSCIIFEAREYGFIKLRDRFYYALFGVMK